LPSDTNAVSSFFHLRKNGEKARPLSPGDRVLPQLPGLPSSIERDKRPFFLWGEKHLPPFLSKRKGRHLERNTSNLPRSIRLSLPFLSESRFLLLCDAEGWPIVFFLNGQLSPPPNEEAIHPLFLPSGLPDGGPFGCGPFRTLEGSFFRCPTVDVSPPLAGEMRVLLLNVTSS